MKASIICVIAVLGLATVSHAAEGVKSGLQSGAKVLTTFEPLNLNGPHAGEPYCLICENGLAPVAMVFAREASEPVLKLLRKLDEACVKHTDQELGAFAVFLSEDDALREKLAAGDKQQRLKRLTLSTYSPSGPDGFAIAPDAEVTVVLYTEHEVKANHAFRRGELSDAAITGIVNDLPKILTSK